MVVPQTQLGIRFGVKTVAGFRNSDGTLLIGVDATVIGLRHDYQTVHKKSREPGAIQFPKGLPPRRRHVFLEELRGQPLDLSRLSGAFDAITRQRRAEYRNALPKEWIGDGVAVDGILEYVTELRAHIGEAINQLTGALR